MMKRMRTTASFKTILTAAVLALFAGSAEAQRRWVIQPTPTSANLHDVHFLDASNGWAVGDNTVMSTSDGGQNWFVVFGPPPVSYRGVFFVSPSNGFAVGEGGTIVHYDGAVWTLMVSGTTATLHGVHFVDAAVGFVVGDNSTVLFTGDGGATWTPQVVPLEAPLYDVHFVNDATGWIAGLGWILNTTDGGASWIVQRAPEDDFIGGISFVDANVGMAVGSNPEGLVLRTDDGGNSWVAQTNPALVGLNGVFMVDANTATAVGDAATIVGTTDAGASWMSDETLASVSLRAVTFADGVGYAVGDAGVVLCEAQPGDVLQAIQFGSGDDDFSQGVAVDSSGVYVAGMVGFPEGGVLPGQTGFGGPDAYVRKYDFDGTELWTEQYGGPSLDEAREIDVDGGSLYVTGQTVGNLPGQTPNGGQDAYVRKYTATGFELWTRQFGTSGTELGSGIGALGGSVYVGGRTNGDLAGTNLGGFDAYVRKYDSGGNVVWTRQFGTIDDEWIETVTVDSTGIYVAGRTSGDLAGTNQGASDIFVRKYDANGNALWTDQFGLASGDWADAIATDGQGGVYVTGIVQGAALPGETHFGGADAVVRKYNAAGTVLWTEQFGTPANDRGQGVSADLSGVVVAGETFGAFNGFMNAGGADAFVGQFDTDGAPLWIRQFGTAGDDEAIRAALGSVWVVGSAAGALLGQPNVGGLDAILIELQTGGMAEPTVPNLEVASFSGPATTYVGEPIGDSIDLVIRNSGTQDVVDTFTVALIMRAFEFPSEGDFVLENGFFIVTGGVPAGSDVVVSVPSNATTPIAPTGDVYLSVTLDWFGDIDEDDSDNAAVVPITVFTEPPPEPGDLLWIGQYGTIGDDFGTAVVSDASFVYSVGTQGVTGVAAGGPSPTAGAFQTETWFRKYDLDGELLVSVTFAPADSSEAGLGIDIDATAVYVAGSTRNTSSGFTDGIVRRLDFNGGLLWERQIGTPEIEGGVAEEAYGVAVDPTGVYVYGHTEGNLGQTKIGGTDLFVRKFSKAGNVLWTRLFGTTSDDFATGIHADGVTGVYVTGRTGGAFAGQTNAGGDDIFIRRMDVNGNPVWTRQFGTVGLDAAGGVTTGPTGVYVTGTLPFPLVGQVWAGADDAVLRKYDYTGGELWTHQFGTTADDSAGAVSVNATGVYVSGGTVGAFPGYTNLGNFDAFARKYTPGGAVVWTAQYGTPAIDVAPGISAGPGGVFTTGSTAGDMPGNESAGSFDGFVARLEGGAVDLAQELVIVTFDAPATASPGSGIGLDVSLAIANTGVDDIDRNFSVGLYLSPDDSVTNTDALLDNGRLTIPNLGAGDTLDVVIPGAAIPASSEVGTLFIGAIVDDLNDIPESDESTNVAVSPILIRADRDFDGVPDSLDSCPDENASNFDRDGDGCIDDVIGLRHIEYWDINDFPMPYVIHVKGAAGISDGSDIAEVQAGVNAWTALPNTEISVNYQGTTTQSDARVLDQVNLVTFSDADFNFGSLVLAVGITTSFVEPTVFNGEIVRPGQIVDADIMFNPARRFSTSSAGSGPRVQGVTTHEAGHVFGLSHSAVVTSTMFYVLPPGVNAISLEAEDELAARKAYPDATVLASGSRLAGDVRDGETNEPVVGAAVFAISVATGDTLGSEYSTHIDGGFEFLDLPAGDYYVAIHPLNGSSSIGRLQPGNINQIVLDNADVLFAPEFYDSAESNDDDPLAKAPVNVQPGATSTISIITNIDMVPPVVTEVFPDSNATNIAVSTAVLVKFSEPVDLDSVPGNFSVTDTDRNQFIFGRVAAFDDDSTLSFIPFSRLSYETNFELRLETGISDLSGNGLEAPFVLQFQTQAEPGFGIVQLVPNKGVVGSTVLIDGNGFATDPEQNDVRFNGVRATVSEASRERLIVTVPEGATSGSVTVTINETTSNEVGFTVLRGEEVARGYEAGVSDLNALPRSLTVTPDGSLAFVATDGGVSVVDVVAGTDEFMRHRSAAIPGGLNELGVTPDGNRVYAISRTNRRFYRIPTTEPFVPLNEVAVGAEPVGIVVHPLGRRAYVSTTSGRIQIWDIDGMSGTFERPIGIIQSPDVNLRRKMAIDPTGTHLFALTGSGKLLVFELGRDSLVAQVGVGLDPRDVVIDPAGRRAYVTDNTGFVSLVSLETYTRLLDVQTGGSLRGIDVTLGGGLLYTVNRELNFLAAIDLRLGSPTLFAVAATIPQRVNPVDVELSPDNLYAFSLSELERRFVATAIGVGPTLESLSRRAGPEGTTLVLAGSGFAADSATTVSFNGVVASPDELTDSILVVTVPSGATSGPVTVVGENPTGPARISNAQFFDVLGPTPAGALRLAARAQPPGAPQLTQTAAVSRLGDLVAMGTTGGDLFLFDTEPESPMFYQFVGPVATTLFSVDDIEITPDGKRAFALREGGSTVAVVDIDRHGTAFATLDTVVSLDQGDSGFARLAVSPDGGLLAVSDPSLGEVLFADIRPESPAQYQVIGSIDLFEVDLFPSPAAREIAFHPGGRYLYVAMVQDDPAAIRVIDISTESGFSPGIVNNLILPDFDGEPVQLSFTPDGNRCLMATRRIEASNIFALGTSNPAAPTVDLLQVFPEFTPPNNSQRIPVSPKGDRAVFNTPLAGFYHLDITTSPEFTVLDRLADSLHASPVEHDYSIDGTKLYASSTFRDSLFIYDFLGEQLLSKSSGDSAVGVVNRTLPAPLEVLVTEIGTETPVEGIAVSFDVTAGGGAFATNDPNFNPTEQTVATDENGIARVRWTLGGVLGGDAQAVQASALGVAGAPVTFVATAVQDPDSLPLELVGVIPIAGKTGVNVTTAIQATFSRAVDSTSVSTSTFFLRKGTSSIPVNVNFGFADGDRRLSLTPVQPLAPNTPYVITIGSGLLDSNGEGLVNPRSSSFTTAAPPPLVLSSVSPPSATASVSVVLSGSGFASLPSGNRVFFNDAEALVTSAGDDFIDVIVPVEAATGSLYVVVGADTSNALPFVVLEQTDVAFDDVVGDVKTNKTTRSVTITPDGATSYAVSPDADVVIPIDLVNFRALDAIPVGDQPVAIDINPDGTRAYVANFLSGTVTVINVDKLSPDVNMPTETLTVGTGPLDLLVTPDGDRLIVANSGDSTLSFVDSDTLSETFHQVLSEGETGKTTRSITITPDGGLVYVGTDVGYVIVDPVSYGVVGSVDSGKSTRSVTITPDGGLLIVLTTEGVVDIFDIQPGSQSENQVVGSIDTGKTTRSVTITPDGGLLYLVQEEDDIIIIVSLDVFGSVSVIEGAGEEFTTIVRTTFVDTLVAGEDPVEVAFDLNGRAVVTNAGDNRTLVFGPPLPPPFIEADIRVTPRTLNMKSNGRYVTGRIMLPDGHAIQDIDISTVFLKGVPAADSVPAIPDKTSYEEDRLVTKFDRSHFQDALPQGEFVPVQIVGQAGGTAFVGNDTIRTIRPTVVFPNGGEVLLAGETVDVRWTSPEGVSVDAVDVWWTPNDGVEWYPIVEQVPDAGQVPWTTPSDPTLQCRVIVNLYRNGEEIGSGMSQNVFAVDLPLSVTLASFTTVSADRAALIQWVTTAESGTSGFHLLRSEDETAGYERITSEPIPSAGRNGSEYQFRDEGVRPNRTYYYKLEEVTDDGESYFFGPFEFVYRAVFSLAQNMPNPFNPVTTIRFTVAEDSHVRLVVYDVAGRKVRTLVNEDRQANHYEVTWNGTDANGRTVASGVYFYKLTAGKFTKTKKMVMLK